MVNDRQVGGDHYQAAIQTWDYILAHDLGYLEGNVIKYVTRHRKKNGVQDLEKALHYLTKLIEVENGRLLRTQNQTQPAPKAARQGVAEERKRPSERHLYAHPSGSEVAHECRTGFRPTSIGDIT